MRRYLWLGVVVGALGGCASANRIERSGDRHEARAHQLDESGNFHAAAKEREAAAKQYSKANSRRSFENVMPVVYD